MRFAIAFAVLCGFSCSKGEPNAEKRIPKLGPPPRLVLPADLRIAVEVDGREREPIGVDKLEATPADFADEERRAWRLETLVGGTSPSAVFAVTGAQDVTLELRPPADGRGLVPVLLLSRRGDLIGTLLDPSNPFPAFHGHGGRLGRPGDSLPRVPAVRKISVRKGAP